MWLEFVEGFSPGTPVFPKTNISRFQFDLGGVPSQHSVLNTVGYYLFILFYFVLFYFFFLLTSPYNVTAWLNKKVMRLKKMITKDKIT